MVAQAGGRTQLGGLAAAAIVLVVILFATGLLSGLPEATLGGILLAVALRIFQRRQLMEIWRFDRWEFALAIACLATVALVGVLQGIGLAVLLAVLDRTRVSARPRDAVMGRVPGTTIWWAEAEDPRARPIPGVLAYRFDAPLYFANASWFHHRLLAAIADTSTGPTASPSESPPAPLRLGVLDAGALTDTDFTGSENLHALLDELSKRELRFALARATGQLPVQLARAGLHERIGADHIFESVDEAVSALLPDAMDRSS